MIITSTTVGNNPLEEMESPHSQKKKVQNAVLGYNLKNDWMTSVWFQDKPLNITVNQVSSQPLKLKTLKLNDSMMT